jgi:hypothetical protein
VPSTSGSHNGYSVTYDPQLSGLGAPCPNGVANNTITVGLRLSDFALLSNSSLLLEDRVKVLSASGLQYAFAANAGTVLTRVGVEAKTGTVLSKSLIDVRDRAQIYGSLTSAGNVQIGNQVLITGTTGRNQSVGPFPAVSRGWGAPLPGSNRNLEPDTTLTLAPGNYGVVSVKSRAKLHLFSGMCSFSALLIEPQAIIELDHGDRPHHLAGDSADVPARQAANRRGHRLELGPRLPRHAASRH